MSETSIKFADRLRQAAKWLAYGLPLTFFVVDGGTRYPFVAARVVAVLLLVELLVVLLAIAAAVAGRRTGGRSRLLFVLAGYYAVLVATSLAGAAVRRSFLGTLEFGDGLLFLGHILGAVFLLRAVLTAKRQWLAYLRWTVGVMGAVNLIGAVTWAEPMLGTSQRLASVFGNPANYGEFLIFGIFLSLYLFSEDIFGGTLKPRGARAWAAAAYLASVALSVGMLAGTHARGAWLGLGAGATAALTLWLVRRATKKKVLALALICVVLISGAAVAWRLQWVQGRIAAEWQSPDSTIARRLQIWQAGLAALPSRPWAGWGWGNYDYAVAAHFPSQIMQDEGASYWFQKAHNALLEHAVAGGVPALIAYTAVIAAAFAALWSARRKGRLSPLSFSLLCGLLLGDAVFNQFGFPSMPTYALQAIIFGFLARLETGDAAPAGVPARGRLYRAGAAVIAAAAVFWLAFLTLPYYMLSRQLAAAAAAEATDAPAAYDRYTALLEKNNFYRTDTVLLFDAFVSRIYPLVGSHDQKALLDRAIAYNQQALQQEPHSLPLADNTLFLYEAAFSHGTAQLQAAGQLAGSLKTLYPTYPGLWDHLGAIALAGKQPVEALADDQAAIHLAPNFPLFYWTALQPAIALGRLDLADEYMADIDRLEHPYPARVSTYYTSSISRRPERMLQLAQEYTDAGYDQRALATLQALDGLQPVLAAYNIDMHPTELAARLMQAYVLVDQPARAIAIADDLASQDPSLADQVTRLKADIRSGALKSKLLQQRQAKP